MAIDFPNSPTNGQTFTVGTKTWTYSSAENQWLLSSVSPDSGTLTTKGDLLTRSSSALVRLPVGGTNNHVLTVDSSASTGMKWASTGAYTAFTPTWTSGITIGNATQEFYYVRIGDFVHVFGNLSLGSTSSISGAPTMTLPIDRENLVRGLTILGNGMFEDAGTAGYMCFAFSNSTTSVYLASASASGNYVADGAVNSTTPFTWTTNDGINFNLVYKAA